MTTKAEEAIEKLNEFEKVIEEDSMLAISHMSSYKLAKNFIYIRQVLQELKQHA